MRKVIDIRSIDHSPGLLSRLIWQELFSEYRMGNGDLGNMDSLLCDLDIINTMIKSAYATIDDITHHMIKFFWRFDRGWTDIITYTGIDTNYYCVNIDFVTQQIIISKKE